MTANDHRSLEDVLAAARRGLAPTAADRERVRRSVEAALVASTGTPAELATAARARTQVAGRRVWPWARRLLVLGAVAAVAGGIGYRAGERAARQAPDLERAAGAVPREPLAPVVVGVRAPSPRPASPAPLRSAREAARRSSSAHSAAPATPNADALAEEIRALRGAERALRESHPGLALALLRELDRAVPNGQLTEERLAVRTIARCAGGDVPFGVNLAQDFAERYAGSVYLRRVVDACAATDPPSSGDSSGRRDP